MILIINSILKKRCRKWVNTLEPETPKLYTDPGSDTARRAFALKPRALVDKMNNARYFDLGMADMRQIALSNISLQYHLAKAPADLGAAYRAYDAKYNLVI